MSTATTTILGHVSRALRFYNQSEIFIGIAKSEPWADENSPPVPDPAARNLGMVINPGYSGTSMDNTNSVATINQDVYKLGYKSFRVTALGANTYEVRDLSDNSLVGDASYGASDVPNDTVIPGVDLLISNTSMTGGDYYEFSVDAIVGLKQVSTKHMVVQDPTGTITYNGQKWLIIDPNDAYDLNCRWVYVEATFEYDELPLNDYRQLGVFTGVIREGSVPGGQVALLPSEIADTGIMEVLDNRKVVYRAIDQKEVVSYIVEH